MAVQDKEEKSRVIGFYNTAGETHYSVGETHYFFTSIIYRDRGKANEGHGLETSGKFATIIAFLTH